MMDHHPLRDRPGRGSYLESVDALISFPIPKDVFDYEVGAIPKFHQEGELETIIASSNLRVIPRGLRVVPYRHEGFYHLQHDPRKQLARDTAMIIQAPSSMTYIRALKWQGINSIISQIELSKNLLGETDDIPIPDACGTPENGQLPSRFPVDSRPLVMEIESIRMLMNHGIFTAPLLDTQLMGLSPQLSQGISENKISGDRVIEDASRRFFMAQKLLKVHIDYLAEIPGMMSIEKGDMYGILPFEQLEKVDHALEGGDAYFDDLQAFDFIYKYLHSRAMLRLNIMTTQQRNRRAQLATGLPLSPEQAELFKRSVTLWTPEEEEEVNKKESKRFQGFTQLQVDLMREHETDELMPLLSPQIADQMQDRTVTYSFPPYYSSANMKRFALNELLRGLGQLEEKIAIERGRRHELTFQQVLEEVRRTPRFRQPGPGEEGEVIGEEEEDRRLYRRVLSLLDPYSEGAQNSRFPHKRIASEGLHEVWPTLRRIYLLLQARGIIRQVRVSEYRYIEEQIYSLLAERGKNPWAVLKLSYYLARGKIAEQSPNSRHQYQRFARELGLHHPMGPFFSQQALGQERDRKAVWNVMQSTLDSQNNFLFRTPVRHRPGQNYYDLLQEVATTPVMTHERFLELSRKLLEDGLPRMGWEQYLSRGEEYFKHDLFQSAQKLLTIYETEDADLKEELMISYIHTYRIGLPYDARRHFLEADFYSKYLIYQALVLQAARDRQYSLRQRLAELCDMEHEEVEHYRQIFYSLATQQAVLSQRYGMQEVPEEVTDRIAAEPERYRKAMLHSFLMAPGMVMGYFMATTGCLGTAGLGCPIAFLAIGSYLLEQLVKVVSYTSNQYYESQAMEQMMEGFKDISMADDESIREFHRSFAPVILEHVMALTIVQPFAKFSSITGNIAIGGIKNRLLGRGAFPRLVPNALNRANVYESAHTLGMRSIGSDWRGIWQGGRDFVKLLFGRRDGVFVMNQFQHLRDLPNEQKIHRGFLNTLRQYFGGDLSNMRSILRRYRTGGFSWQGHYGADEKLSVLTSRGRYHHQALEGGAHHRWWHKLRAKRLDKLYRFQDSLQHLLDDLDQSIPRGDSFESFVQRNLQHWVPLKYLPLKGIETPSMMLDGIPMMRRRIPIYGRLIEGIALRRIFTAYDNLLGAHALRESTEIASGRGAPLLHSTYHFVQETFDRVSRQFDSGQLGEDAAIRLLHYQEGLAGKISIPRGVLREYPGLREREQLLEILFYPDTREQRVLAEQIWNSNDLQTLMQDQHLEQFGLHALDELHNIQRERRQRSIDDLDLSFRLLRVVMGASRPEMLQ